MCTLYDGVGRSYCWEGKFGISKILALFETAWILFRVLMPTLTPMRASEWGESHAVGPMQFHGKRTQFAI